MYNFIERINALSGYFSLNIKKATHFLYYYQKLHLKYLERLFWKRGLIKSCSIIFFLLPFSKKCFEKEKKSNSINKYFI